MNTEDEVLLYLFRNKTIETINGSTLDNLCFNLMMQGKILCLTSQATSNGVLNVWKRKLR